MLFILHCIWGGFNRVWFGSDLESKIWSNRGLQTISMIAQFMCIFLIRPDLWYCWIIALVISCWLQFQYWSRGHGEVADTGRHKDITPKDIERYNDRWYHYVCDWLLPKHKYGFLYDFIYLMLRYTCPMIPMMLLDWRFVLIGLSVAPIYAFSMTLEERESWLFERKTWWWRRAWSLAEILSGVVTYGGCYLICRGL